MWAADGGGSSLEIIDPLGLPSSASNWRASVAIGGSPGTDGAQTFPAGDYDHRGTVDDADHADAEEAEAADPVPATEPEEVMAA